MLLNSIHVFVHTLEDICTRRGFLGNKVSVYTPLRLARYCNFQAVIHFYSFIPFYGLWLASNIIRVGRTCLDCPDSALLKKLQATTEPTSVSPYWKNIWTSCGITYFVVLKAIWNGFEICRTTLLPKSWSLSFLHDNNKSCLLF